MSTEPEIEEDESDQVLQSLHALTEAFTAFLLPAIHTILRLRNVYPPTSFLSCRAYDFPVYQSRHPAVCVWISDAVTSVKKEVLKGLVRRVALVIVHPQTLLPLERYVWDISEWPMGADLDHVEAEGTEDDSPAEEDAASEVDVNEQMRALLSRLVQCNDRLHAIPKGCTFTIAVELKAAERAEGVDKPAWVACTSSQRSVDKASRTSVLIAEPRVRTGNATKVLALPAIEAGEMAFEMWIEEGKEKLQALQQK